MNLKDYNTGNYKHANIFKRLLWMFFSGFFLESFIPFPIRFKTFLLEIFGAKVGRGVVIKPKVKIKYPWRLTIGDYVWIGEEVWIDNLDYIRVGNNVCISQGAYLLTGNHNYKLDTFDLITAPIELEDEVWIGAMSVVCPGTICRRGSVLTVGSVAVNVLESNSINKGNPAQKIKDRISSS